MQGLGALLCRREYSAQISWRWWSALLMTVFAFTITIIVSVAVLQVLEKSNYFGLVSYPQPKVSLALTVLLSQLLSAYIILRVAAPNRLDAVQALALARPRTAPLVTVLLIAMCAAVDWLAGTTLFSFFPEEMSKDGAELTAAMNSPAAPYTVIGTVVGAPIGEEVVFRGFLLGAMARSRIGFAGATVVTGALFAAIHLYSAPGTVSVFVLGVMASYLLWRTGSLWPCIALHGIVNINACFFIV